MSLIEVLTLINTIFFALTYIDGYNKIASSQSLVLFSNSFLLRLSEFLYPIYSFLNLITSQGG